MARTPTGFRVEGELDLATAPVLASHLAPLPDGTADVVVDVSRIDFVDSTGLSVLVQAHHTARSAGRRLVLVSPSLRVRRLLEITGLDDVMTILHGDGNVDGDGADGSGAGSSDDIDGPQGITA